MPLTQYLWSWDHFLHGGQDFELGILMALTLLCLALLLSKQCKRNLSDSLARIRYLAFNGGCHLLPFFSTMRTLANSYCPLVNTISGICHTQLQI